MNIESVMTRQVDTATPDLPLAEAGERMRRGGFHHLPVVQGDCVVGMLSLRDVSIGAAAGAAGLTVGELMTPCPAVLRPTDSIRQAIELAVERRLGAFPVLDRSRLVGIVSVIDLLAACLHAGGTFSAAMG